MSFPLTPSPRPVPAAQREAILADPGFGAHFGDHMALAQWSAERGWHDRRVGPLEAFSVHPGSSVLHYGQEVFEGLKALRQVDGRVALFRPDRNARRFAGSARRLALPELGEQDFVDAVTALVRADEAWVPPYGRGWSLYLRPFLFASEVFLGVRAAERATFCVIASPAASYFAAGAAITLWVSTEYSRAAPGGTGAAKCGGNYAGGLLAQRDAREHGCDQVLFLDAAEHRWVEEAGTMNLFVVTADGELVTPPLGTILDGVTRESLLALATEHDLRPVERPLALEELQVGCASGAVTEVFAAGTAAALTPVAELRGDGFTVTVGDGHPGKRTLALRQHLLDIQTGRVPGPDGWVRLVG